ncbi:MAG: hypothetical protein AAF614_02895 [Chloroflexota bacterium]
MAFKNLIRAKSTQRLSINVVSLAKLLPVSVRNNQLERKQIQSLRTFLAEHVEEEACKEMVAHLSVDYYALPARAYSGKIWEFLSYLQRRQRLDELVAMFAQQYPDIAWEVAGKNRIDRGIIDDVALEPIVKIAFLLRYYFSMAEQRQLISIIDEDSLSIFKSVGLVSQLAALLIAYCHYFQKLPELLQAMRAARPKVTQIQSFQLSSVNSSHKIDKTLYLHYPWNLAPSQFVTPWSNYFNRFSRKLMNEMPTPSHWLKVSGAEWLRREKPTQTLQKTLAWPELHNAFLASFDIHDLCNVMYLTYLDGHGAEYYYRQEYADAIQDFIELLLRWKREKIQKDSLNLLADACCVLKPQVDWEQIFGAVRKPHYHDGKYYLGGIYAMLLAAFEKEKELVAFCRAFRPRVMLSLSIDMELREMIRELMSYMQRHNWLDELIDSIAVDYPDVYALHRQSLIKS